MPQPLRGSMALTWGMLRRTQGAVVGERVFFGEGGENQPEPDTANKVGGALALACLRC